MKNTDMTKIANLLDKNGIDFITNIIYNEDNEASGWAIQLEKCGRFEFTFNQKLKNIVDY